MKIRNNIYEKSLFNYLILLPRLKYILIQTPPPIITIKISLNIYMGNAFPKKRSYSLYYSENTKRQFWPNDVSLSKPKFKMTCKTSMLRCFLEEKVKRSINHPPTTPISLKPKSPTSLINLLHILLFHSIIPSFNTKITKISTNLRWRVSSPWCSRHSRKTEFAVNTGVSPLGLLKGTTQLISTPIVRVMYICCLQLKRQVVFTQREMVITGDTSLLEIMLLNSHHLEIT